MDCFIVSERSVLKYMALPLEHAISTFGVCEMVQLSLQKLDYL
jgi:hypothetical protein